jgi:hypothetical protein
MWINEALELIMDAIENGTFSLRRASRAWNIPMSSISNHLNGKTKSRKIGPRGVLTEKKDAIMITWTLVMGECGLSISLQQLKMKVVELTQTKVTPFRNGIPSNNWWY